MNTNQLIKSDLHRYWGKTSFIDYLKGFYCIHGFRFSYFMRKSNSKSVFRVIYRFIYWRLFSHYGIMIHYKTKLGYGLYIGHFGNIVVNGYATIGNNCNLSQGVTIGAEPRGQRKGVPTIGNNVWFGTNCVVVGNITIGNNVLIAPLTFVNFDVPNNSIVVGNPAKVIPNTEATKDYVCNTYTQNI